MMQRFEKTVFVPLDEEERELIESIERDEWVPVRISRPSSRRQCRQHETPSKKTNASTSGSQRDYHQIQIKAIEEGMPYQTLIASIVHKYLNRSLAPHIQQAEVEHVCLRANGPDDTSMGQRPMTG